MIFIVGLGNPGKKFDHTRHNAGFMVVDFFAKKNQFPDFEFSKKYDALICEHENVTLVKPQTFMNESGKTVKEILKHTNSGTLIVIHDDIDVTLGKIKFSTGGGPGGHKGIDSIISNLGSRDFVRLKFGIGNHETWSMEHGTKKVKAEEVVLKKFTPKEKDTLQIMIETSTEALDYFIEHGLEKTMNKYN